VDHFLDAHEVYKLATKSVNSGVEMIQGFGSY
jgi:hypothetical protein